jgi:multidrug efflux system membrane fusion protein
MSRRLLSVFILSSVLALAAAGGYLYRIMHAPPGAPAPAASAPGVQTIDGETVVTVAPAVQRASGIDVAPLAPPAFAAERIAYATFIDPQPLFDLGARLAAARADRDGIRAQAEASQAEAARMQALYDDDRNVSLKSVQGARAAARADQARLRAAETTQNGVATSLRQQFGAPLANAAAAPDGGLFRQLSDGLAAVVRVTLPAGDNTPAPPRIAIDAPDGHRIPARKLSAAPQIDPLIQGASDFYLAERALPAGSRAIAHMADPAPAGKGAGLLLPAGALIWYGGQRWAYVRTAADRFTRRPALPADAAAAAGDAGIIVASGFRAGDEVVVRGAQLLLSEEQRPQGIATQCKDPPECDD